MWNINITMQIIYYNEQFDDDRILYNIFAIQNAFRIIKIILFPTKVLCLFS